MTNITRDEASELQQRMLPLAPLARVQKNQARSAKLSSLELELEAFALLTEAELEEIRARRAIIKAKGETK
jgi:hypothetical protein